MKVRIFFTIILCLLLAVNCTSQVRHPSDLQFRQLEFNPPDPVEYRIELNGGLRAYMMEDPSLPQFSITAFINFGDLYLADENQGFGSLMSGTIISGGTTDLEGEIIEERLEFLGGSLNFSVGERISRLTLWVLCKDIDEGLDIFFDVLQNPEFREGALGLTRARLIQQLRQANDQPAQILSREYEKLIYGEHPLTARPTRQSYMNVSSDDLKAVHAKYFVPGNIILAASGDFKTQNLKNNIEKRVAEWQDTPLNLTIPKAEFDEPKPGVYFIQKEINQGYVSLGHLGIEETNTDYYEVQIMNFILGGGSFTSRITTKVRSDEGLSYNQGSRFTYRWGFPGTFSGYVQTKSETAGYAISLIQNEFERIRESYVSDDEMAVAINYYLESFPSAFESPQNTMNTFAQMEMTGKPMDYYHQFRDNIRAVTKEKVREAANKYIQPGKMVILIVGDFEPCNAGGDKWQGPLDKLGRINHITLTNPMTGT